LARLAPAYARRPEETALYGIVHTHLESLLAHARDHHESGLPKYVEQEFRSYLRCGIFAHGFVRAHCDACGHDLLVAFSCKTRGLCPSCNGRRMSNTAANLVDRVLPNVPVRQYVLSLPFELRKLAAFRAEVLTACAQLAMQRGEFADVRATGHVEPIERRRYETAVETHGFNVHAGVRIARDDDMGREKLCRYGARPPFAMDRIQRLPGGRIAYRTKVTSRQRARSRVMTPIEFLARLAALIPPPRHPLVRFHGVLAPKSSWRKDVVPKPPTARGRERPARAAERCNARDKPVEHSPDRPRAPKKASDHAGATTAGASAIFLSPNVLSVKHWDRLEDGLLVATTPRVAWPMLLRRCFSVDVLECANCGGRLRVMAVVTAEASVSKILDHLKMPSLAPPVARARAPDDVGEQGELGL
jgi:hypothetical protein